jgi:alpha-beta hydrolase superfamily lysophospholipase
LSPLSFSLVSDYLFAERKAAAVGGSVISKYDQILPQLYQLLDEHPNYSIHLTGHSLGGALATLFAFRLAASEDPRISSKPITCVSIASPRLGNLEFRRAFQVCTL